MRSIENLRVWFMPISPGLIRLTYNRFNSNLKDVHITEDTSGDQLKTVFDNTITEVYSALMGISARKQYPYLFQQTHELLFSEQVRLYTMRSLRLSLSTTK